ncbi:hypothetical protein ZWY2020_016234 [Hordeum vulgare]|nr:hypothetical protein ZWY2020_016234 [Hordeum vulgare]
MAPGSSIVSVTEVPESDCGDRGLSPSHSVVLGLMETLQCPNGHTICSSCKHRVDNHCPTCRQELGNIRCLALEKVAESIQLPCKYQSLGCTEIHPYQNKLKHEEICRFRPYSCPYAGSECLIAGDVDLHEGCTFNHRHVFKCFGQHFCLHFEAFLLGMSPVCMAFLRFMGEESEARASATAWRWAERRKLTWQGTRSIRDGHKKVRTALMGSSSTATWPSSSPAAPGRSSLRVTAASGRSSDRRAMAPSSPPERRCSGRTRDRWLWLQHVLSVRLPLRSFCPLRDSIVSLSCWETVCYLCCYLVYKCVVLKQGPRKGKGS